MKKTLAILFAVLLPSLVSCQSEKPTSLPKDYTPSNYCQSQYMSNRNMFYVCTDVKVKTDDNIYINPFDTSIYLQYASTLNATELNEVENIVGSTLTSLHAQFDRHHSYTIDGKSIVNVKTINDNYGLEEVEISAELYHLLDQALEVTVLSEGLFNPFIGELTSFWDSVISEDSDLDFIEDRIDVTENPIRKAKLDQILENLPVFQEYSREELNQVLELKHNEETDKYSVKFNKYQNIEKISLTLGGIAKGYATQMVEDKLLEAGYSRGAIFGGGSSINVLGNHPTNKYWRISLPDPTNTYDHSGSFKKQGAFSYSTSGDRVNGVNYRLQAGTKDETTIRRHHIINPTTGYPENHYRSTGILSETLNSALLDSLSTVLMNIPFEKVPSFIQKIETTYNSQIAYILFIEDSSGNLTLKMNQAYRDIFEKNTSASLVKIEVI